MKTGLYRMQQVAAESYGLMRLEGRRPVMRITRMLTFSDSVSKVTKRGHREIGLVTKDVWYRVRARDARGTPDGERTPSRGVRCE
jgi:hypothetical protein